MTTLYIASKSSNSRFALEDNNIIAVCFSGPNPESNANSYAFDYVGAFDAPAYIYKVEIESCGGYKIHKEVVSFGPTE